MQDCFVSQQKSKFCPLFIDNTKISISIELCRLKLWSFRTLHGGHSSESDLLNGEWLGLEQMEVGLIIITVIIIIKLTVFIYIKIMMNKVAIILKNVTTRYIQNKQTKKW
uniref:Uncharacterized protein n=1 Tax=Glossina palpalis gambiensis TaxID=67801 RepID=A0A1B0B2D1_9MUSC